MSRETMRSLIETVQDKDIDLVCNFILKLIPEDTPLPDEIEAIRIANEQRERGETYSHDEVWA